MLNVLLIREIKIQNAVRARFQGKHHRETSSTKNSSLVAMMVSVSLVFEVTTLPGRLVLILNYICNFTTDDHCIFSEGWLYHACCIHVNHSVNFFLY